MFLNELFEDVCPSDDRPVSYGDLITLERQLDQLFKQSNVDVSLTGKHFLDRVNDSRNLKQITICELREMFKAFYNQHKGHMGGFKPGFEAVLTDINTAINVPFVIKYNAKLDEIDLVAKTVMRKRHFATGASPSIKVDSKRNSPEPEKNAAANSENQRQLSALVKAGLRPRTART